MKTTNLYFIADADRIFVKIGLAQVPDRRLRELQAGSPIPLFLYHVVEDVDPALETDLHQYFAADWRHREWFYFSKNIRLLVSEIIEGTFSFDRIPPAPFPKGYRNEHGWLETREDTMRMLRDGEIPS